MTAKADLCHLGVNRAGGVLDPVERSCFKVTPWLKDVTDEQKVSFSMSFMNLQNHESVSYTEIRNNVTDNCFLLMPGFDSDG